VLFLDNLESLQRPDTLELDASEAGTTVSAWIAAAETLCDQGLVLLARLPAYRTPVPMEGIVKLALDLPDPERLLKKLLAVSLVEQREAPDLLTREYQCSPLVAEWLRKNPVIPSAARDLSIARDLGEARDPSAARDLAPVLEPQWLQAAADRWALDWIVGSLERAGLYASLLDHWLPPIRHSQDPTIRAQALNLTGVQHHHIGEYQTALD